MQNPLPTALPPPSHNLDHPPAQLIQPTTTDQHPTDDVHQPNQQRQQPTPLLRNGQKDRLDVELEEDAGNLLFADHVRLLGDGVLVGEDGVGGWGGGLGRVARVDGRDDGEVVLEFVEVKGGRGDGAIERVLEGGVERAEGEFGDDVGEVECCCGLNHSH